MSADFKPTIHNYKNLGSFRFWCQKVLPAVYDDSLSYYEVLCKVTDYLNNVIENMDNLHLDMEDMYAAYGQLETYVNSYFDNLDVQNEINNKLDAMAAAQTEEEKAAAYDRAEDELGDFLFATVNAARLYGLNPDTALERTCAKFRRRFTYLEEQTIRKGRNLKDMTLAEMDAIWDEGKAKGL